MKEIGKLFKEKRRKMDISLADVHKAIKIREKYISAIEDGDTSIFFAEVYYRSFVRSYAEYLGFDPEELFEKFGMGKRLLKKLPNEEEKNSGVKTKLVGKVSQKNKIGAKKKLIIFIIAAAFFVFFLFLNRSILNVPPSVEIHPQIETLNNQGHAGGVITAVEEKKETLFDSKQKLVVEAVANTWIKIDSDGRPVFEGTVAKGSKNLWEADRCFELKIGYVPGVKMFFNGKQVDVVSGAVRDVNTVILEEQ
jgi:transcriptional regulator with XRE-family HTH domain